MKKAVSVLMTMLFLAGIIPAFAGGAETQKESVFQQMSDSISGFAKTEQSGAAEKKSLTKVFQKSSDYIKESSPKAKELSLRGNKDEIARRRGQN